MSYTTVEQLRPFLVIDVPVTGQVLDQPCRLHGLDWIPFVGAPIQPGSLRVKSRHNLQPQRTVVTLTDTPLLLTSSPLVPESIVVASDSSLGTVYTSNIDYVFDALEGTLVPKQDGRLAAGAPVCVWFETYTLYAEGDDYALAASRAEIRRLSGGEIGEGETVYLDYAPLYAPFSEGLLEIAAADANGQVEREIDPAGQFGADPTLSSAARHLALEIICRAAAMRELAGLRGEDRAALAWLKLAEAHAPQADRLLRSFRPPVTNPNLPTIR